MTTLAPPPAVTEYANAVRDHLAGLDAETLDELTGGLEADLAEALAERMPDGGAPDLTSVTSVFGSPGTYAEELRVAAGVELPAAAGKRRRTIRDAVGIFRSDLANDWQRWRTEHRWFGAVVDFLVVLRPVWWVARGWVIFMLFRGGDVASPFGHGFGHHVILLGLVVLSVLWGQRRIGQRTWVRRVLLVLSLIAAVAVLPFLSMLGYSLGSAQNNAYGAGYDQGYLDGVANGNETIVYPPEEGLTGQTNIFVYDSAGQPVENARLLDENGDPIVLVGPDGVPWDEWTDSDWFGESVPAPVIQQEGLNVYPWRYVPGEQIAQNADGSITADPSSAEEPQWPVESLDPIESPDATDAPTDEAATPSDDATQPEQPAESEQPADPTEPGATTTG